MGSAASRRRLGGTFALLGLLACLLPPAAGAVKALPDGRGWELVSPVDKNGGNVGVPGGVNGGGVFQAAADGSSVTYSSNFSFGPGALAAPAGSQYLSTSLDGGGWATVNIDQPAFSGSYGIAPEGVPFQLFSPDLARGLLLSGRPCRSEEALCPVANPPLAGTDAPPGYQNFYLRQGGAGLEALLGSGDLAATDIGAAEFDLALAGAAPDFGHVVLSSCAALTPTATEVPLGEGCDSEMANLYEWSPAAGMILLNSTPGAALAAPAGAMSATGARIYWVDRSSAPTRLMLGEGAASTQVDGAPEVGGGGTFQTAAADGGVAYFTKAGHLYRYTAPSAITTDLTPAGGVSGVLGASADGSYLYYYAASNLYLAHNGGSTPIATPPPGDPSPVAAPGDYPPATGTVRVSADGTDLVFLSKARLTGYDNTDQKTGLPDSEVFLYDAGTAQMRCVSCNPKNAHPRPLGPATIPGAVANGQGPGATAAYKPRVLSADSSHVFFESADALVSGDSNNEIDVYQWEAQGYGDCIKAAGCVDLLSDGQAEDGARFLDASASGSDVFFATDSSLLPLLDPGSVDLYDARVGGGTPEPLVPIPCKGDSCQSLPSEPVDPGLGTLVSGPGNGPISYVNRQGRKPCGAMHQCPRHGKGKKHGRGSRQAKKGSRR